MCVGVRISLGGHRTESRYCMIFHYFANFMRVCFPALATIVGQNIIRLSQVHDAQVLSKQFMYEREVWFTVRYWCVWSGAFC